MASASVIEHLIPEEVGAPVASFVYGGLTNIERVLKGPQPRQQVPPHMGYSQLRQPHSSGGQQALEDSQDPRPSVTSPNLLKHAEGAAPSLAPSRRRDSRRPATASFMLATLPAPLLFADAEHTQIQLRLLTDTVRHILAGTAARTMAQAFIHPIDTVKTRLQVNKATAPDLLRTWRMDSKTNPVDLYVGRQRVLHMRNWLITGPRDLYRGITGAILGTIPVALVYFSTYEACKGFLEGRGASGATVHLASASAGAVASAFVRVPTDILRHRVQAYYIPNIFQGARSIMAREGVAGLYHGFLPTLLRDVPELALQFTLYEKLRHLVQRHRQVDKLRTWEHLVLGGCSGAMAASATMPLDVAKTALQCGNERHILQVFSQLLEQKGVHGLFAGMGPRVTQTALMSGLFFMMFEVWKNKLKPAALRPASDRLVGPKLFRKRRDQIWKRQFVYE